MKKTLTIRAADEREPAPTGAKKGRGWNVSDSRLDTLHDHAREMRRNPSPAQTLLAERLAAADTGRFSFKRYAVIGSAIVDFACQPLRLVVALDDGASPPEIARRRDRTLAELGFKVLRYDAADVVADPDGATRAIVTEMEASFRAKRPAPRHGTGKPYPTNARHGPQE